MAFRRRRRSTALIYAGIRGFVVALDQASGAIVWSTELRRGSTFVPIVVENGRVFATSGGEVTCLDAETGQVLWHNMLKGYGVGYAMLAGASNQGVASASAEEEAATAAAAATSASATSAS